MRVASVEVVDEGFHRVSSTVCRLVQLGLLEVGDGDGFVAVWAGAAGSQADGEGVAVRAALLAEQPNLAVRAAVDGSVAAWALWRQRCCRRGWSGGASSVGGLPARW